MILPPWLTVTETTVKCNYCKVSIPLNLMDHSLYKFADEHTMCAFLASLSKDNITHCGPMPRKEIATNG